MKDTEKGKVDIMKLLQDKAFLEALSKAVNLVLAAPISLLEKNLQYKNEQHKEQIDLEKERLVYQKEKANCDVKIREQEENIKYRITLKWLWYSGILFFLSVLAISMLGWKQIISAGVAGTILAGLVGYVFGKGTSNKEETK